MPDSLSNWLALREPADTAARAGASHALAALTAVLARTWGHAPLRVLDLAAGTGSNFRYLAPRLATPQDWLLVDHDVRLLAEVPSRLSAWGERAGYAVTAEPGRTRVEGSSLACTVETRCLDLGAPGSVGICAGHQLVTASALLDLVSERWLHALAEGCRGAGAAVFFALTYNGLSRCSPPEPEDSAVLALFNQHQARDKGLGGPAAGPGAVDAAVRAFKGAGYHVRREDSDWVLAPDQQALQRELIEGWATAAAETAPEQAPMIGRWLDRRIAHVEAGCSRARVRHEEFAAWL